MAVIMDPIAVLVMIAHIMKQYVTMAKPITKKTIQTMMAFDLGRNGPYLNRITRTEVIIEMLVKHITSQTSQITLGCIPMACMMSAFWDSFSHSCCLVLEMIKAKYENSRAI